MIAPLTEYTQTRDSFLSLCKGYKLQSNQVKQLEEKIEMSKKDVILKLKDCLIRYAEQNKKQIEPEKISAEISNDLREYVTPDYVRKCLGSEFKDQSKVRERKPIMITTEGSTVNQEEEKEEEERPTPKGETNAERNKRYREEYERNKYKKITSSANAKIQRADKKEGESQQQTTPRPTYTGPSIGPKEEEQEEEEDTIITVYITDTDMIDEICLLRQEQNAERIGLEIDLGNKTVIGIKKG